MKREGEGLGTATRRRDLRLFQRLPALTRCEIENRRHARHRQHHETSRARVQSGAINTLEESVGLR